MLVWLFVVGRGACVGAGGRLGKTPLTPIPVFPLSVGLVLAAGSAGLARRLGAVGRADTERRGAVAVGRAVDPLELGLGALSRRL